MAHTWHPSTFGLLYGKTAKTACSRRVATGSLVKPEETDCTECRAVISADVAERAGLHAVATQIAQEAGYSDLDAWAADHRVDVRAALLPNAWRNPSHRFHHLWAKAMQDASEQH